MLLLIRRRIWLDSGFNQCECHIRILHGMSVLAVIEQGNPIMPLGEIHPFLPAALKARHIPARILVCLSGQIAKLYVKRRLVSVHCHWEMHL